VTLEQWQAKALYLQEENEKLRRELLDERILAGVIRLESPETTPAPDPEPTVQVLDGDDPGELVGYES